jgi:hypothetical protein
MKNAQDSPIGGPVPAREKEEKKEKKKFSRETIIRTFSFTLMLVCQTGVANAHPPPKIPEFEIARRLIAKMRNLMKGLIVFLLLLAASCEGATTTIWLVSTAASHSHMLLPVAEALKDREGKKKKKKKKKVVFLSFYRCQGGLFCSEEDGASG